jgi:phosphopantothenoylcysteine decarboxylase/phosphopantothenate--cysteine ligase
LVGFAAESHDVLESALKKIERKNLDAIIANDISRNDIGFQADDNEVTLLFADGSQNILTKAPKPDIAQKVLWDLHQAFTLCPSKTSHGELPKVQALS